MGGSPPAYNRGMTTPPVPPHAIPPRTHNPQRPSLQKIFLTGVLTLLPIWLTWVVVKFVFVLLSDTSRPLVDPLLRNLAVTNPQAFAWLQQAWVQMSIGLLATLAVILLSGVMARRVFGQRLLRWFEALVARVPLANTIYGSARKLLDILQTAPDGTQRVVLIDFPHTEMKSVGFVTRVIREHGSGRELAAVYVPTTPNPTSGYLEIVPVEKMTPTDWTVDQAMSFIISGGAVSPESIPFSVPAPPVPDR
jgi:uncharacterized membrane protein